MIYEIAVKAPKDKEEEIEEFFYQRLSQGWETSYQEDEVVFKFYFKEDSPELEEIEKALAKYPFVEIEYRLLEEKNWAEIWKANFKPLKVGRHLWVVPPWEKGFSSQGEVIIWIEPGQAFGTGHHPTTQMMLEHIELFSLTKEKEYPYKVLDLGCGTGILAITCAKLLPKAQVWAVDIDEEAIKACLDNLKLNQVEGRVLVGTKVPVEKFDLIIANIGYRELKNLAPKVVELSEKDKTNLFLTGILNEDSEEIVKLYESLGYRLFSQKSLKEWSFLWMIF
ncbi:50S ribosomal protein L11 methyltransferase [Thermodesulfobacterium sp. TA1]|uniref:50S ribosomal protein L11 methyltransferase n=1 Tax=Thermodesulfobacterium sp. TA1 TaxID=2234087 RepID=UPI0012326E17|nr:50S ribosomal protein L11 methyltransferase [Thermodesulfobacterium sp. TA1]QER41403.1 50S ribosomal protein L11 methyltransferase [Thermodesulfobacterium sp. TA1]